MDVFFEDSQTDRNQLVVSKGVIFEQNLNVSPQLRIESLPSSMCQTFQRLLELKTIQNNKKFQFGLCIQ